MSIDWGKKDPVEVVYYGIDFSTDLAVGDSLSTAVWSFLAGQDAGCSMSGQSITGTIAKLLISGGTDATNMAIQCIGTTAAGETLRQLAKLKIRTKT